MTSKQNAALGRHIVELRRALERVAEDGYALKEQLHLLALCKIPDPRYPYWDWILVNSHTERQRLNLGIALMRLTDRITGAPPVPEDTKRDVDGVPREILFGDGPPAVEEIFTAIKGALELVLDRHCVEVIRALDAQGLEQTVCEYVLARIDAADPGDAADEA